MPKSQVEMARAEEIKAADAALERADTQELRVLFDRANQRYDEMEDALGKVVSHYIGGKNEPRHAPNDNAIAALEHIALEALGLARFVVESATVKARNVMSSE